MFKKDHSFTFIESTFINIVIWVWNNNNKANYSLKPLAFIKPTPVNMKQKSPQNTNTVLFFIKSNISWHTNHN